MVRLNFEDPAALRAVVGEQGANLRLLEREVGVKLRLRGNQLTIQGSEERSGQAANLLMELYEMARRRELSPDDLGQVLSLWRSGHSSRDYLNEVITLSARHRPITPRSPAQKEYVDAIRSHDVVVGIGPAGTGKTYLAMAMAVAYLTRNMVDRIILTRPAVEAGERLGFLPGDIQEKVNPYLRPLYDALHDMMDFDRAARLMERGVIEVAPLAFMRGRTLNDAFIILDEAQNTTSEQMKMFLTRLGFNSKMVITGDITQIDLPPDRPSGLVEIQHVLRDVEGVRFVYFSERDVVRHPLVQEIVRAYERSEAEGAARRTP